jgi:hypothetical protein
MQVLMFIAFEGWRDRVGEAVSGCLWEAAGAELRRGRALRRGNTAPGICVRSVGDAKRPRSYDADPRL